MKPRFLLPALIGMTAVALTACSNTTVEGDSSSSSTRRVESARYVYNPATYSYEWQRDSDGGRTLSGAYQQ